MTIVGSDMARSRRDPAPPTSSHAVDLPVVGLGQEYRGEYGTQAHPVRGPTLLAM